MSDTNGNIGAVDFTLDQPKTNKKRRMLFFKRPKGTPIPVGVKWICVCGTVNVLNAEQDQYCTSCGSRLRNQENDNPAHTYHTCVIVSHFTLGPARR